MLDFLDWGHVVLYMAGAVFLILEGMPVYLERTENASIWEAYGFLLKALFWPLVAVYIIVVRIAIDIAGDRQ